MKFLFIHALKGFSLAGWNLRQAISSTGVQWKSFEMTVGDMSCQIRLRQVLATWRPDFVGFSCHFWSIDLFLETARWLRLYLPETKTVFGGPQVNSESYAQYLLSSCKQIDYIIRGAGELPLARLVEQRRDQFSAESIPGLSYRKNAAVQHNRSWDNSFWMRSPIFCRENRLLALELEGLHVVSYETIRGCINRCAYCQYTNMQLGLLDDKLVEQELEYLFSFHIPHIRICDSHFGGVKIRAERFLAIMAKVNRSSSVKIYPNLAHVDRHYLALALDANAEITSIGIQTTNPRSLAVIHRHSSEKHVEAIRLTLESFPDTPADLITGLPGDDLDGVRKTFRDVIELGFRAANVFQLAAFPGSEVYENQSIWQDCIRPTIAHDGTVLESSDFPASTVGPVAHLTHALGIALILKETQQTLPQVSIHDHILELLESYDHAELAEIYDCIYIKSPAYLFNEFGSILCQLSSIGNWSPPFGDALAIDMARWLYKRCLQQSEEYLVCRADTGTRRVSQLIVICISGRIVEIDLKRKFFNTVVHSSTSDTQRESAAVLDVASIFSSALPRTVAS